MADRNKGSRRKKRQAPAPPPFTEVKDARDLEVAEPKVSDSQKNLGESPTKMEETSGVCLNEVEEQIREVLPELNEDKGQKTREYPEELNPFAGDSDSDTNVSSGGKTIVCGDVCETGNSNSEKNQDSQAQQKQTGGIYDYPKGLCPFSDESDTDVVDVPKSPLLSKSSEMKLPIPGPQAPPRTKRRRRKQRKDKSCSGCSGQEGTKGVSVYKNKSTEEIGVPKDLTLSEDDNEPVNGNNRGGNSVLEAPEDRQKEKQATIGKTKGENGESGDCYPEYLNPFAGDSDSEHGENGMNPKETETNTKDVLKSFGDDPDSEKGGNTAKEKTKREETARRVIDCYPEHLNPFGEDSDSEHEDDHGDEINNDSPEDAVAANGKCRRITVDDYPEELNPFAEDVDEEIASPRDIPDDENGDPRLDEDIVSSGYDGPIGKKRLGRVKSALKSFGRLIRRLAACTRPQAESEM